MRRGVGELKVRHGQARTIRAAALAAFIFAAGAVAHSPGTSVPLVPPAQVPHELRVLGPLPPPSEGVVDLKFRDVYELPVGPRGLVVAPDFKRLDGRRVRIVGYMVALQPPTADAFMFSPLPAAVAAHDEGLADDIPASTLYVHLPRFGAGAAAPAPGIPQAQGLLQITGVLSAKPHSDATTGRIFPGSIVLDPEPRRAVMNMARSAAERRATPDPAPPARVLAGAKDRRSRGR